MQPCQPKTASLQIFSENPCGQNRAARRGWAWLLAVLCALSLPGRASERTVLNALDAGPGSLRATVDAAASGDSIRFHSSLSGQTVLLASGPLTLDKSLTIDAAALPKGVTLSGGKTGRIFEIASGGGLALRALILRDGHAPNGSADALGHGWRGGDGGAIYNAGTLTMSACTVLDSIAGTGGGTGLGRAGGGGNGGAIFNLGVMALSNCTFYGNAAGLRGAGSTGFDGFGSAICNVGAATVSACTIAGNGALSSTPSWAGFSAGTGTPATALPPWPAPPAPPATVFLSPTGSDTNAGTRAAPLRTAAAALAAIGGQGEIVLLGGDYVNLKFNLDTARRLTIRADLWATVRVFLGEKVTAFTHESGLTWRANVAAGYDFTENDNRLWIFEWGTPEGPIPASAAQPLQLGRTYRLASTRLVQQTGKRAVGAGPGRFWYDAASHSLYLSTTDGSDPNGRAYWIPSQTAQQSLVYGGTPATDITVDGIQVYFGRDNLSFNLCRSYIVRSCQLFGASNEGLATDFFARGYEENNEYAANGNDGSGPGNYSLPWSSLIVVDPWTHDNGDEGHSIHTHIEAAYFGGLYEYNVSGGITPGLGAKFTAYGPYTRANTVGLYPAAVALEAPVSITALGTTNPTVITTAVPHGLHDGETVRISDVTGSSPDLNGDRVATVLSPNTFSVAVPPTAGATGGSVARLTGTSGTACDWVSNADFNAAYSPTPNGILTLLHPTVIAPVSWALGSGIGSTIEAYDATLVSVGLPAAGAGLVRFFSGVARPNPAAENSAGLFTAGRLEIGGTIVAGNLAGNFSRWGSVTDLGSNLTAGDPLLAPPDDFGGPTPTMALRAGSPARNAALTAPTATDQRGLPRPVGAPDIGAYEAGTPGGFHVWSLENIPGYGTHQFCQDCNQNGICDGLEYALPGDPLARPGCLALITAQSAGQPINAISFPYRVAAHDLIYIVEHTTDLTAPVAWQEILRLNLATGVKTQAPGVTSQLDPLTGTAIVLDTPAPPNATPPKLFWRLRVEPLP